MKVSRLLRFFGDFLLITLSIVIILNAGCEKDSTTNPIPFKKIYNLWYLITDGSSGKRENLLIYVDGPPFTSDSSSFILSHDYDFTFEMNLDELNSVINVIYNNNFFTLEDSFLSAQAAEDIYYEISVTQQDGNRKHIKTSEASDKPDELINIMSELNNIIVNKKNEINCGVVKVEAAFLIEEWPFSTENRLPEFLGTEFDANEAIFNHFKNYYYQEKEILYFEDDWIYRLSSSGGYNLSYHELDRFIILVHDRFQPCHWPENIGYELKNISGNGLLLQNNDYFQIKEDLLRYNYPLYYLEGTLETGKYLYEIFLVHGNNRVNEN